MIKKDYNIQYNNNNDIKDFIKYILKDNGIKQVDIMEKLDINKSAWRSIINKKNITLDDLKKICDVLGYEIEINIKKK